MVYSGFIMCLVISISVGLGFHQAVVLAVGILVHVTNRHIQKKKYYDLNCVPENSYVEVLTPQCNCFWR